MSNKNIFIFLGPPGSGKGTLSQYCVQRLGWQKLSTGDLCRKNIQEATDIGKRIDFAIKSGKLIDDQLIISMVKEWLNNHFHTMKSVILDGFPRTVPQAEALERLIITEFSECKLWVVVFDITDEMVVRRLSSRLICGNLSCQAVYSYADKSLAPQQEGICTVCNSPLIQRSDDTSDAIRERLKIYHIHEQQVLQFLQNAGLPIIHLEAEQPVDQVYEKLIFYVSGQE